MWKHGEMAKANLAHFLLVESPRGANYDVSPPALGPKII